MTATATATVAEEEEGEMKQENKREERKRKGGDGNGSSSENMSSLVVLALPVPTINNVQRRTSPKAQIQPQFHVNGNDTKEEEMGSSKTKEHTPSPVMETLQQPAPTAPMHPELSQKFNQGCAKKLRGKNNKQQEEGAKIAEQFEENGVANPIAPCSFDTYSLNDNPEKKRKKRSDIVTVARDLQQRVKEEEIEGQPEGNAQTMLPAKSDEVIKPKKPNLDDLFSQFEYKGNISLNRRQDKSEKNVSTRSPGISLEVTSSNVKNVKRVYPGRKIERYTEDVGSTGIREDVKHQEKAHVDVRVVSPYFMKSAGKEIEKSEENPLEMGKTINPVVSDKGKHAKKAGMSVTEAFSIPQICDIMKSEKEDVIQIESDRVSSKRRRKDPKRQKKADGELRVVSPYLSSSPGEKTEVSVEMPLKNRKRMSSVINNEETKRANLVTKDSGQNLNSEEQEIEIETKNISSKRSKMNEKGQKKPQTKVKVVSPYFVKSDGEQAEIGEKKPLKSKKPTKLVARKCSKEVKVSPWFKNATLGKENALGDSGEETMESNVKQKRKAVVLTRAEKMSEAYRKRSPDNNWKPPRTIHNLLQERHAYDPWRVLVICLLLNKTSGTQVKRVLPDFFALCPNAKAAIEVETDKITEVTRSLGLYNQRSESIQRFSREYLEDNWTHVTQLHGVGKYAADGYAIFCNGNWELVKPHDHMLDRYWDYLCHIYGPPAIPAN